MNNPLESDLTRRIQAAFQDEPERQRLDEVAKQTRSERYALHNELKQEFPRLVKEVIKPSVENVEAEVLKCGTGNLNWDEGQTGNLPWIEICFSCLPSQTDADDATSCLKFSLSGDDPIIFLEVVICQSGNASGNQKPRPRKIRKDQITSSFVKEELVNMIEQHRDKA